MIEGANIVTYKGQWAREDLQKKLNTKTIKESKELSDNRLEVDCSVAYLSQCYSVNKCREQCKDYGAGYYRYFYDGCCQCIGPTCHNYGIDESLCRECKADTIDGLDGKEDTPLADDPGQVNKVSDDQKTKKP